MTPFSVPSLIPETKGRSLEDMDIIFGSVSAEERQVNIEKHEKRGGILLEPFHDRALMHDDIVQDHNRESSNSLHDEKV